MNTYREILQDSVVLDKVREELGNTLSEEELKDKTGIFDRSDSQILDVRVMDTNPQRAAFTVDREEPNHV